MKQFYLAKPEDQLRKHWIQRLDARYWQVATSGSARAALVAEGADRLHLSCAAQRGDEIITLYWDSSDSQSHSLLRIQGGQDYRGLIWSFSWRARGLATHVGAVAAKLVIEGRDEAGVAQRWQVPALFLSNADQPGRISIDFDACYEEGGTRIWAGDIQRISILLYMQNYTGTDQWSGAGAGADIWISAMQVDGAQARSEKGDAYLPRHPIRLYLDYDDLCGQTPAALVSAIEALGYAPELFLDIGRARFFPTLAQSGCVDLAGEGLNRYARRWLQDFLLRAKAAGFAVWLVAGGQLPLSAMDNSMVQQGGGAHDTGYGLWNWHQDAPWQWLKNLTRTLAEMQRATGHQPAIVVRDLAWDVDATGRLMLQAPALKEAYQAQSGESAPAVVPLGAPMDEPAQRYQQWCVAQWTQGWSSWVTHLRGHSADVHLGLAIAGRVMSDAYRDALWPDQLRDAVQMLLYMCDGPHAPGLSVQRGVADYVQSRPIALHYLYDVDASRWRDVQAALHIPHSADAAPVVRGWPAIVAHSVTFMDIGPQGDEAVQSFEDIIFPLDVAGGFHVTPAYQTQVVRTTSGHEFRNAMWALALARYDAAAGVRSREDMELLLRFFHARMGRAVAFCLRDPLDYRSSSAQAEISAQDQLLGLGDGQRTRFQLVKTYQDAGVPRPILLPRLATVRVAVDGVELAASTYHITRPGGVVDFATAPAAGAVVTAGFVFDVPVRFEEDHLDMELQAWRAGAVPSVPLCEVRTV